MAHTYKHGETVRDMNVSTIDALTGHGDPGKFGRMFPTLPPMAAPDAPLEELARAMVDDDAASGDNPHIPAGFTYLGQFVDHDLTLDTTPLAQQIADPTATENFRTPALDLDSLYRDGPGLSPQLYGRGNDTPYGPGNKFLMGMTLPSPGQNVPDPLPNDLPRNRVGRALIGDERNDENLAVAQTHLAFLKFHNAVIDHLTAERPDLEGSDQFAEARRIVTWHYQWIVLYDWVERLTEEGLIDRIRHDGRRFYRFKKTPYMPAEFSGAAYRLGHSMVRQSYDFNRVFREGGLTPATFNFLFGFTGKSGAIVGDLVDDPNVGDTPGIPGGKLHGLPGNWIIDWRRFYDFSVAGVTPNASRLIDTRLASELLNLPGETGIFAVLAYRNMKRGVQLGLPSGQAIALHAGLPVMSPDDVAGGAGGDVARAHGLHESTPLWYYILREAELFHGGQRLGPVGALIVAETMLGIVHGDHNSFLWQRSNWSPELPAREAGNFRMTDMIDFIAQFEPGFENPIGDA